MNKNIAQWNISLDVECPGCGQDFDVTQQSNYGDIIRSVEVGEGGQNIDVICPACEHDFTARTED